MKKAEAMTAWRQLDAGANPLEHMTPIPYKSEGSRYGACGIRIDGNPRFIDAVLSNLKPLLDGETHITRLELARNPVKPTTINGETRSFGNADNGAEVCYVRLHVRGREGAMASSFFDRELDAATERFAVTSRSAR
ncbi:hypothetical protein LCGC14_1752230 [marine sediment metagenome]|uniref:Uncharacterized protein n=1 Tax=marine sediment metagenome TaxID=412755 RepID=A0A0F9HQW8_9ZZZZ